MSSPKTGESNVLTLRVFSLFGPLSSQAGVFLTLQADTLENTFNGVETP